MPCPDCGKPHKRGVNNRCSACYQKSYRSDPDRRKKHRDAVKAYSKRNPDKRREWVQTHKRRTGQLVPDDVHDLRRSVRRLYACLRHASRREGAGGAGD